MSQEGAVPVPSDALQRFVLGHYAGRVMLQVAVLGGQGCGYGGPTSPFELKGIFVEATENLVGLSDPPRSYNWVGEFEGLLVDYSTYEVGHALRSLLRGDGSILERIYAPLQLLGHEEVKTLQTIAQGAISQRFFTYYRNFGKGVLHRSDDQRPPTPNHILSAYRSALTGINLLRTGEVSLDLPDLARRYAVDEIADMIKLSRDDARKPMTDRGRWAKAMVKVHSLLEEAIDTSEIPVDPPHPDWSETYLLKLRRRFFEARKSSR